MTFNEKDKAVLIGLIMGDGHISKENKLQIRHSKKQKDYCIYKAKLMHSVFGGDPIKVHNNICKYIYKVGGVNIPKQCEQVWIQKGSKSLKYFRDLIYTDKGKTYSEEVLNMMNELSLMLWWLDDGNLNKHKSGSGSTCWTLRLSTYTTYENAERIQKWFKERWGINWYLKEPDKRSPNMWCLHCGKKEGEKFLSLFRERVLECVPSMAYKVLFDDTSARHSENMNDDIV